jgi:hypothetical protein
MFGKVQHSQFVQRFIRLQSFSKASLLVHWIRQFCLSSISRFMALNSPLVLPPIDKKKHSASVIWMHGLGDTGEGWRDVMEILQENNPHIKFILPTA